MLQISNFFADGLVLQGEGMTEEPAPQLPKAARLAITEVTGIDNIDEVLVNTFNSMKDEFIGTLNMLLRSREDAIDMAQEAFLRCWRIREQMRRVSNHRAWIFQVGMNAARDLRKSAWKRKTRPLMENAGFTAPECGESSTLEGREELEAVRNAVLALRPEEREVFLLRQNGEMTYEEIASLLNRPVGTVKTQMRTALQRVKAILAPHSPETGPAEGTAG